MALRDRRLFGHPPGLPVLISLKVWEQFSYHGMRAFLVFYLLDAFGLRDNEAALVYGSYAALVLAFSVFGGYCGDRWLGPREAMGAGAGLIMAGHTCLALENLLNGIHLATASTLFQIFCLGLAFICVGTALLKPNVLTVIGRLYRAGEAGRDTAFNIYYIGINLGGFIAPIACGAVANRYGWSWGFGAAALGMAAGLASFVLGRRWVQPAEPLTEAPPEQRSRLRAYSLAALAIALSTVLVQHGVALGLLLTLALVTGAVIMLQRTRDAVASDRRSVLRFFLLLPVPAAFELFSEQLATTVNLFSDRAVARSFWGLPVTAPQILSLNSLFVLLLLPPLAALWASLAKHGRDPPPFTKFAGGFVLIAAAFAVLALANGVVTAGARIPLGWVICAYILITLGELCIAPAALAAVGRMLPERYVGVAMGMVLLAFAAGSFLSSILAAKVALPAAVTVPEARLAYGRFFLVPAAVATSCALACVVIHRALRGGAGPWQEVTNI